MREQKNNTSLKKLFLKAPTSCGVYLMKSQSNQVLYVGKAKNIRNRLKSYLSGRDERVQVSFLLDKVKKLEFIVTKDENQALSLERDLIIKYKPRYNIRLKDDKSYLHIKINLNTDWPRLEVVRKPKNDSSLYFGPYTSSYKLRSLLDAINKVLPLRTCSDNIFYNRQRPCLEHQIGRCCAPCCLQVSREEYKSWIKQAISILEGKVESVVAYLEGLMDKAAGELRFEDAARYRDKIEILKEYSEQGGLRSDDEARDIFGIYREGSLLALSVLIYRRGRLVDSFSYTFEHAALPDEEILLDALTQYYTVEKEVPKEILLPLEVKEAEPLIALLKKRCGRKPVFLVPKRGLKKRLIELANLNAREKFITTFYQERNYAEIAKELQEAFSLSQCPRRIEAVDISHFQGSNISGAVVSFYEGQPDKERYRLFNIRGLSEQDDFAAISEVIKRHLTRCIRENFLPDLLLIDGGKNQLNAAKKSAEELNVEIDIIALAKARSSSKKPERVFLPSRDEPLPLSLSKPSSKLLIKIRDEVHRFVINHHRKRQFKSSLAEEASY